MNSADLAERIDRVEHRMDSVEQRLDSSYAALSTQILQSNSETRDAILATLRTEMGAVGATLRTEMGAMGADLRAEMGAMQAATTSRFDTLETALADGLAETRRFMLILHEDVLSRIALLGEGRSSSS